NIVFLSNRSGAVGLWSVMIKDGKPTADPAVVLPSVGSGSINIFLPGATRLGNLYYTQTPPVYSGPRILVTDTGVLSGRKGPVRSFPGSRPALSPDGKHIAYLRLTNMNSKAQASEILDVKNSSLFVY